MELAERFRAAWVFEAGWHGVELLPTSLARAAARVLEVDAAGISAMGGVHRVPLGASSAEAATAERWQFTLGAGPCFSAYDSAAPVLAAQDTLQRRWPALADQLHHHGPIRSVVALPIGSGATRFGALDLYSHQPRPPVGFDVGAAQLVASLIHTSLLGAALDTTADAAPDAEPVPPSDPVPPAWLDTAEVRRREQVWVAIGMSTAVLGLQAADALALLRARAYAQEQTLEELTGDVVAGRVLVQALSEQAES